MSLFDICWRSWCGAEGTTLCSFQDRPQWTDGIVPLSRAVQSNTLKDQMDVLGSLRVSWTFLSMSPCFSWVCPGPGCVCGAGAWLELAVMSVSMEGKKNTRVARPGRVLKKEKEVEGGWWGECGVEKKYDLLVLWRWNLDFTPLSPFLNCEGWVLPSQVCKVRLKSVCL